MKSFEEKSEQSKQAVSKTVSLVLAGLAAVYLILLLFGGMIFGQKSVFYRSLNPFSQAGNFNPAIRMVSLIFFICIASYLLRLFLSWVLTWLDRGKAFVKLLMSFIKYLAAILIVYMALKLMGVDTATLLAGVGIMSLIVGLGAQPLIEDILSGLFIVFEGVFDVGDIIVYDGFRGEVKEIGARTIQIVDMGGNVKVINNSDLRDYVNMTSQLSLAISDIQIEYGESLERVEAIIARNIDKIGEAIPDIVNGPYYKGVSELGSSGVTLRFFAECRENAKYQVQRDLNRHLKLMFDENKISVPFPQVVVHQPEQFEAVDEQSREESRRFLEEQRKKSSRMEESNMQEP